MWFRIPRFQGVEERARVEAMPSERTRVEAMPSGKEVDEAVPSGKEFTGRVLRRGDLRHNVRVIFCIPSVLKYC